MDDRAIVIVHRGALGDFLTAWPGMLSLCDHHSRRERYWIGPASRLPFLKPLGVHPCPGNIRRGFDLLFAGPVLPEALARARLYWFHLASRPPVSEHENLIFLQGLCPAPAVPVRRSYAVQLQRHNIPFAAHWLERWRDHFGPIRARNSKQQKTALLFPGAGHPAKQWPLVQFLELARWLERAGLHVCLVLGPAEVDRGMRIPRFPVHRPSSLADLLDLLRAASLVVGNDSGPMHLAGMVGVHGLALFGPASIRHWAPAGLHVLASPATCSPCTRDGRIDCADPRCMGLLDQKTVRRALGPLLARP